MSPGPGHDDPEMAKLTQAEHELEQQSHDLIRKYSETEDQQVRDKAKSALREMLTTINTITPTNTSPKTPNATAIHEGMYRNGSGFTAGLHSGRVRPA